MAEQLFLPQVIPKNSCAGRGCTVSSNPTCCCSNLSAKMLAAISRKNIIRNRSRNFTPSTKKGFTFILNQTMRPINFYLKFTSKETGEAAHCVMCFGWTTSSGYRREFFIILYMARARQSGPRANTSLVKPQTLCFSA